jgi:hypothetical protein
MLSLDLVLTVWKNSAYQQSNIMIRWAKQQLKEYKIDRRKLESLLNHFEKCEKLMQELKLSVYASDGSGYLIHQDFPEHDKNGNAVTDAIVADIGFGYDGGGW